ncbi:MAG: AMP-binding protein [Oscillospiraceae bacterium]|nr:AMP-binding protein [Oscillospiraceae bacterium]
MSIYQQFCKERFNEGGSLTDFEIKCPENFNFGYDVVDRIAELEPDKTALVWCNTKGDELFLSFRDMQALSNKAANVFRAHGLAKGDKVMVMLKRHYEYWFTVVALHKLGAVLIPVTHMLTREDIEYRINSAKIKGVVCSPDDDVPQKILSAKENCNSLSALWTVQETVDGFINLSEEMQSASELLERQATLATEPMVMYFTSGTTGYPKGVIHDHTYPLSHIITAKYWQQVEDGGLHFTVAETGWAKASWGKIYGQWLAGSAVMVFDFDNFEPKQLMTIINRYQVTTFCAPPTVYRYLVKKGTVDMPSLKHASTAGEALNPEVFHRFTEQTGISLMEGFGQTESALILGNLSGSVSKPGSMGKPSPLYHVEVLKDDGTPAEAGEVGELVIVPRTKKQAGIFVGYHENRELYNYVWRGGVYHTGDTAWKDKDGYFWFVGRIDDVIKTGGFRVGPFEIENVLMEHPAVMECSVIGVPDDLRGQAIKAVVVLSPGYEASSPLQKEIREFSNKRLAEYKWIRFIEFVPNMPKTISGKIRKMEQRE